MFGNGNLGWLEDAPEDSAKDANRLGRFARLPRLAATAVPAVAVTAVDAVEGTSAGPRCGCGAGLVGPFSQLAKLIPAALGVLDVIAVEALNIAPTAASGVGAPAVALGFKIGYRNVSKNYEILHH